MRTIRSTLSSRIFLFSLVLLFFAPAHGRSDGTGPKEPLTLKAAVSSPLRFVAFGDTRFHDPADKKAGSAAVRHAMVAAIDKQHPDFISIGGDIVYTGADSNDWQVWDSETELWRQHHIPIYPALGNHDLKGDEKTALGNYFARFPQLQQNTFYSVQLGNCLMLVLDSGLDETTGPQGEWLQREFDALPGTSDYVFVVLHHPPYTSSSDDKEFGGGHSARAREQLLGKLLETRQPHMRAQIVVFSGHVHNYEHHEHGGVTYFVTGGGGAHPYPITRAATDLYQDPGVNYHFLLVEVAAKQATVTMNKLDITGDRETWSTPDVVKIAAPAGQPGNAR